MKSTASYLCIMLLLFGITSLFTATAAAQDLGNFMAINTKTFDKEKFVFPSSFKGRKINLLFLGMSNDQDNGQALQLQLLDWHKALAERGAFSDDVMPYHFMAMNSPPFFVKGIIRNAMGEVYEGVVPANQGGVLYLDDLDAFAKSAGLTVDEQATIVLTSAKGKPIEVFKGPVSEEGLQSLTKALGLAANSE